MRYAVWLLAVAGLWGCAAQPTTALTPQTTVPYQLDQIDPAGFVRFNTPAEAANRRQTLVNEIWPDGLPSDTRRPALTGTPTNGYAIVHLGHGDGPLNPVVNALVVNGYAVTVLTMPADDHNTLFEQHGTEALQLFLNPVITTINYLTELDPSATVIMTGLSGGAWTTHLAAAIDERIDVSIPVAGALPLFARPFSPGSVGDAEQEWKPIYAEIDSNNDGIPDAADGAASWLEIFALATTSGRRQLQILNEFDNCCFRGDAWKSYAGWLTSTFPGWSIWIDSSHRTHSISPDAVNQMLEFVSEPAVSIGG